MIPYIPYSLITFSILEFSSFIIILSCSGGLYFSTMIPFTNSSGKSPSPTEFIIIKKYLNKIINLKN